MYKTRPNSINFGRPPERYQPTQLSDYWPELVTLRSCAFLPRQQIPFVDDVPCLDHEAFRKWIPSLLQVSLPIYLLPVLNPPLIPFLFVWPPHSFPLVCKALPSIFAHSKSVSWYTPRRMPRLSSYCRLSGRIHSGHLRFHIPSWITW